MGTNTSCVASVQGSPNGFQFGLSASSMPFADGTSFCANLFSGGKLASIHSSTEYTLALDLIKTANFTGGVFIGLQDTTNQFSEGTSNVARFSWVDGTAFDFGNVANAFPWGETEPNNDPANAADENCAQIRDFSGTGNSYIWNDQSCADSFPVLCRGSCLAPTAAPTKSPTKFPTRAPTKFPTNAPTKKPTNFPTNAPTKKPTNFPTNSPTKKPTIFPTKSPTKLPTKTPTKLPTLFPTSAPTRFPTLKPTESPNTNTVPAAEALDITSLAIGVVGAVIIFSLLGFIFFLTKSKKHNDNSSKTKFKVDIDDIITSDDEKFKDGRRPSGLNLLSMAIPQSRGSTSVSTVIAPLFTKGFTLKGKRYEASRIKNGKKVSDGSNVANAGGTGSVTVIAPRIVSDIKISSKPEKNFGATSEDTSENGIETYIDDLSSSKPSRDARQHPDEVGTVMDLGLPPKRRFFSLKPKSSQMFPPDASIKKKSSNNSTHNPRYLLHF